LISTLVSAACSTPKPFLAPRDFARIPDAHEDLDSIFNGDEEIYETLRPRGTEKYISPEGLLLRRSMNKPVEPNDAEFWRDMLATKLMAKGYKVLSKGESLSKNMAGTHVHFSQEVSGNESIYIVHFFVRGRTVHILEVGGPSEVIKKSKQTVEKTLSSWEI
jgi:hypothetical protein